MWKKTLTAVNFIFQGFFFFFFFVGFLFFFVCVCSLRDGFDLNGFDLELQAWQGQMVAQAKTKSCEINKL